MSGKFSVDLLFLSVVTMSSFCSSAGGQVDIPSTQPPILYRWDSKGRPCILEGPSGQAGSVVFSPDGNTLFVSYDDARIYRYDARTGRPILPTIAPGSPRIHALAVSPDGQRIAVAVADANHAPMRDLISICKLDGTVVGQPVLTPAEVITLAYSADGKTFGTIDLVLNIRVWGVDDRGEIFKSQVYPSRGRRPEEASTRASFSADLKRAVIVNDDDDVVFNDAPWSHLLWLWEAEAKKPRLFGVRVGSSVVSALVSPDGSQFVMAQEQQNVYFQDFVSGDNLQWKFPGSFQRTHDITFLKLSPDNRRFVTATKNGDVLIEDLNAKQNGRQGFTGPYGYVRAAAFVPGGIRFATGGWSRMGAEKIPGKDWPRYEPVLLWEVKLEPK